MEIEPEPTISSESFDKYALNERCRVSRERVQGFVDRGLTSQDSIYHRYTEKLSERLTSAQRSDQPTVIEDIRASFQRLRDTATGYLSLDLFKHQITQHLLSLSIPLAKETSTTLLSILTFHASQPFPSPDLWPHHSTGHPLIDEDTFVRAVCLLTLSPFPFQGPNSPATHDYYSGTWGPHSGRYVARRGKDAGDFRRRVFRSIAIPDGTSTEHATMVSVPRFVYYEPVPEGEVDEDDVGTETVVVEEEREVEVGVVDVLSECPPEEDRLTANPFRESYRVALPSLPRYKEDLIRLFVPTARLVELMELVQKVQAGATTDWAATIERFGSDGKVGWREFDSTMAEHSGLIADGLSKIFGAFTVAET